MLQKHQWGWLIASIIIGTVLMLLGAITLLWSLMCIFLGGAEGKRGSGVAALWGLGFLFFSIFAIRAGLFFMREALKTRRAIKQKK